MDKEDAAYTHIHTHIYIWMACPGGSNGKESAWKTGDRGSVPALGRSSGEENGNPLLYSCLENSKDRGAW